MVQVFKNLYVCPCGCEWTDEWSCACNDRCPECGTECEPDDSEERLEPDGYFHEDFPGNCVITKDKEDEDLTLVFKPYEGLPKLSVFIILYELIINECILIEEDRLNIGYYRNLFNDKFTSFGFRPIRDDEFTRTYIENFMEYYRECRDNDDVFNIYPDCDPFKLNTEDYEFHWENFAEIDQDCMKARNPQ